MQLYCNTHTFISVLYHFPLLSYYQSLSHLATLNSYNFLRLFVTFISSLLIKYITPRTNHTKVCIILKSSPVLWSKKIRLNPSNRPPYKIQRYSLISERDKHRNLIVGLSIYLPVSDTTEHLYYLYDS